MAGQADGWTAEILIEIGHEASFLSGSFYILYLSSSSALLTHSLPSSDNFWSLGNSILGTKAVAGCSLPLSPPIMFDEPYT